MTEQQKRNIKIGAAAAGVTLAAVGGLYLYKVMQSDIGYDVYKGDPLKDTLDLFSDNNGVYLKQGTTFQRISSKTVEDYKSRGETYVSYKFRDNMKYKERMPKQSYIGKNAYVHKIKTAKAVKAPSSREAAKIYLEQHPEAAHYQFKKFMQYGIRDPESPDRIAFVNELKKRGFNAVIDENDFGGKFTESPLILLDPSSLVKSSKSRKLSAAERVIAVYFT